MTVQSPATQYDKLYAAAGRRGLRVGLAATARRIVRVDIRERGGERQVLAACAVTDIVDLQTASTELLAALVQIDREREA